MKQYGFALLCLFVGLSTVAQAKFDSRKWDQLENEFQWSHKKIEGEWKEGQKWAGLFCDEFYNYKIYLGAALKKIDFELTEEGNMIATADVANMFARVDGQYRTGGTLCMPMVGWLGAGSEWGKMRTEVRFGESGDLGDVKLKILSTRLGKLQLGRMFPGWFEDFFTGVVNRALTVVWNSKLGDWISEKVTQAARKHVPDRSR